MSTSNVLNASGSVEPQVNGERGFFSRNWERLKTFVWGQSIAIVLLGYITGVGAIITESFTVVYAAAILYGGIGSAAVGSYAYSSFFSLLTGFAWTPLLGGIVALAGFRFLHKTYKAVNEVKENASRLKKISHYFFVLCGSLLFIKFMFILYSRMLDVIKKQASKTQYEAKASVSTFLRKSSALTTFAAVAVGVWVEVFGKNSNADFRSVVGILSLTRALSGFAKYATGIFTDVEVGEDGFKGTNFVSSGLGSEPPVELSPAHKAAEEWKNVLNEHQNLVRNAPNCYTGVACKKCLKYQYKKGSISVKSMQLPFPDLICSCPNPNRIGAPMCFCLTDESTRTLVSSKTHGHQVESFGFEDITNLKDRALAFWADMGEEYLPECNPQVVASVLGFCVGSIAVYMFIAFPSKFQDYLSNGGGVFARKAGEYFRSVIGSYESLDAKSKYPFESYMDLGDQDSEDRVDCDIRREQDREDYRDRKYQEKLDRDSAAANRQFVNSRYSHLWDDSADYAWEAKENTKKCTGRDITFEEAYITTLDGLITEIEEKKALVKLGSYIGVKGVKYTYESVSKCSKLCRGQWPVKTHGVTMLYCKCGAPEPPLDCSILVSKIVDAQKAKAEAKTTVTPHPVVPKPVITTTPSPVVPKPVITVVAPPVKKKSKTSTEKTGGHEAKQPGAFALSLTDNAIGSSICRSQFIVYSDENLSAEKGTCFPGYVTTTNSDGVLEKKTLIIFNSHFLIESPRCGFVQNQTFFPLAEGSYRWKETDLCALPATPNMFIGKGKTVCLDEINTPPSRVYLCTQIGNKDGTVSRVVCPGSASTSHPDVSGSGTHYTSDYHSLPGYCGSRMTANLSTVCGLHYHSNGNGQGNNWLPFTSDVMEWLKSL